MIKRNPALLLLGALGVGAFVAVISVLGSREAPSADTSPQNAAPVTAEASQEDIKALQSFNDSSFDTLRTIGAQLEKSEAEKEKLSLALTETKNTLAEQQSQSAEKVSALETQLTMLSERLNTSLNSFEEKFNQGRDELRDRQSVVHDSLDNPYDELGIDSPRQNGDLPVGTGSFPSVSSGIGYASNDLVWTDPLDAHQDEDGNWVTPAVNAISTTFTQGKNAVEAGFDNGGKFDANQKDGTPVYTLHRGAMLANSVSMTALMGRIPMNGQVTDPYPFSMIVGRDNLLANGFTLPDVQGAIVTGTVTGDWSLSCVRGVVESIDFIRSDGSILSFPEEEEAIDSSFDGTSVKTDDLGFLADPNGNPCLTGQRISNAPEYLTTKGLLDAATAAANAAAIAQQTVSVDGSTSTSAMTGSATKNAAYESAGAFTSTVSDFIQARMGSSFDIIYAPPGTVASIHLRKPVTLRAPAIPVQVRYQSTSQGGAYALP